MTYTSEKRPKDWQPEIGQSFIDPDKRMAGRVATVVGLLGSYGCIVSGTGGRRTALNVYRLRRWRGTWEGK